MKPNQRSILLLVLRTALMLTAAAILEINGIDSSFLL